MSVHLNGEINYAQHDGNDVVLSKRSKIETAIDCTQMSLMPIKTIVMDNQFLEILSEATSKY